MRVKASGAHEDGPVSPSINVTTLDSGRISLLLVEFIGRGMCFSHRRYHRHEGYLFQTPKLTTMFFERSLTK